MTFEGNPIGPTPVKGFMMTNQFNDSILMAFICRGKFDASANVIGDICKTLREQGKNLFEKKVDVKPLRH